MITRGWLHVPIYSRLRSSAARFRDPKCDLSFLSCLRRECHIMDRLGGKCVCLGKGRKRKGV